MGDAQPLAWVLVAAAALAVLAVLLVRWVPVGHVGVVLRGSRVVRVVRRGAAVRRRPDERVVLVATEPDDVRLVARADTRDGVEVVVEARAVLSLVPQEPGDEHVDQVAVATEAAERRLAAALAGLELAQLPHALRSDWPSVERACDAAGRPVGVRVVSLELCELDAVLASDDRPDPERDGSR